MSSTDRCFKHLPVLSATTALPNQQQQGSTSTPVITSHTAASMLPQNATAYCTVPCCKPFDVTSWELAWCKDTLQPSVTATSGLTYPVHTRHVCVMVPQPACQSKVSHLRHQLLLVPHTTTDNGPAATAAAHTCKTATPCVAATCEHGKNVNNVATRATHTTNDKSLAATAAAHICRGTSPDACSSHM